MPETVETETPTNQFGDAPDPHLERFPEGTPAAEGTQTLPSGQGGKTPHDGISYQDQFPPNPEPSDFAKKWGEYLDAKERGEDVEPPVPGAEPAPKAKAKSTAKTDTNP